MFVWTPGECWQTPGLPRRRLQTGERPTGSTNSGPGQPRGEQRGLPAQSPPAPPLPEHCLHRSPPGYTTGTLIPINLKEVVAASCISLFPLTSDQDNLQYMNFWSFPMKQNQPYSHFQEQCFRNKRETEELDTRSLVIKKPILFLVATQQN